MRLDSLHQDFAFLSTPTQFSALPDVPASDAIMDRCVAAKNTEFYPLPTCRVYLRNGTGYISSPKDAR
jgi:hypothetical protein